MVSEASFARQAEGLYRLEFVLVVGVTVRMRCFGRVVVTWAVRPGLSLSWSDRRLACSMGSCMLRRE